ncbi:proton-coupled amino acid transporter-like protein CG1139 [Chelonus insularis]|uniref:proton-coupled amino acid transporter-like protein CG1139 n=1 Tax=Chelonus insularis TaxID=460826 RepID=UPI001588E5FC|nr:proton-coupled amino acid transporter-like protein CG1139 [Chelonus insularis]
MPDPEVHPTDENVDEPYDPFNRRSNKKYVSEFGSFANLVKSATGTGLFAMPSAFANVGMFFGIVGVSLMGLLITICLKLLMKTHLNLCASMRRSKLSYDQIVAFSVTKGFLKDKISVESIGMIVDTIILTCYIGVGSVYVIFISGIIQELFDPELYINQAYYCITLFPFFFLLNLVKGLDALAPISIIGNILVIITILIGITFSSIDTNGNWVLVQPEMKKYPKFLGIAFFSLVSPGLALAIQQSMKNPSNFTKRCGVLNWGMSCLVILHALVGSIGYAKWGDSSMGNFIQNLPRLHPVTIVALVIQAFAIYFTYGLQCYLPITILHHGYALRSIEDGFLKGSAYLWNILCRLGITLITCSLAAAIPQLYVFTNLVGALCIATLGFVIPISVYAINQKGDFGKYKWRLLLSITVLILGLIAMVLAVEASVIGIFYYMNH